MEKELQESKKALSRKYISVRSEQLPKNTILKTQGHDDIREFWF